MKLKKEFADFYNDIRIDSESDQLRDKRNVLENDIRSKLPVIFQEKGIKLNQSDIRMIDQGSYKYHTTIKSDVVDRDVAVIIPVDKADHDPRTIKGYLRDSINIDSRTVSIKEPCIRASYCRDGEEWLHIDLPLYAEDGSVFLARGKEFSEDYKWESADPDGLNDYICDALKDNEQLRRIICYIKKWRNEKYVSSTSDHEIPPSIGLTLLAIDCFSAQMTTEGDDDLLSLQKTMKSILGRFSINRDFQGNVISASISRSLPVTPYTDVFKKMKDSSASYMVTFYNRIFNAVDNLTNAVNVESPHDAGEYVQKVLGTEFVVPAKEAVAAKAQSRREHSFG